MCAPKLVRNILKVQTALFPKNNSQWFWDMIQIEKSPKGISAINPEMGILWSMFEFNLFVHCSTWCKFPELKAGIFQLESSQKKIKELFSHKIRCLQKTFDQNTGKKLYGQILRMSIRILMWECSYLFFDQNSSQKQNYVVILFHRKYW